MKIMGDFLRWPRVGSAPENYAKRDALQRRIALVVGGVLLFAVIGVSVAWAIQTLSEPASKAKEAASSSQLVSADSPKESDGSPEVSTPLIAVHVVGHVVKPGVYFLPKGSRAVDAIEAAHGLHKDAMQEGVNLASPLMDGAQIYVPSRNEVKSGASPTNGSSTSNVIGTSQSSGTSLININTAAAAELETLPGIGPATAAKIIADREKNGHYASLEDLGRVSGIGEKKIEALSGLATAQ